MQTATATDLELTPAAHGPWRSATSRSVEMGFAATQLVASLQFDRLPADSESIVLQARVSRNQTRWSPWLRLAVWRAEGAPLPPEPLAAVTSFDGGRVDIDIFRADTSHRFRFAQIRVVMHGENAGAGLRHVSLSAREDGWRASAERPSAGDVRPANPCPSGVCQFSVPEIGGRICSPTALWWAMRAARPDASFSLEAVTCAAFDPEHDLYGNWPRAIAAAGVHGVAGRLQFLGDFAAAVDLMRAGRQVIASIRYGEGELPGAPQLSTCGHLVAIRGYGAADDQIYCFDPASPADRPLPHTYPRDAFLRAWLGQSAIAYVIG